MRLVDSSLFLLRSIGAPDPKLDIKYHQAVHEGAKMQESVICLQVFYSCGFTTCYVFLPFLVLDQQMLFIIQLMASLTGDQQAKH